jgi:hypothetical protein
MKIRSVTRMRAGPIEALEARTRKTWNLTNFNFTLSSKKTRKTTQHFLRISELFPLPVDIEGAGV